MIVSLRTMTYDGLKELLDKQDKIILWTCNLCIRLCGTGGLEVVEDLQQKLLDDGYNVIWTEKIGYGCHIGLIRDRTKEPTTAPYYQQADTMVVLTCTDGYEKVAKMFSRGKLKMKKVIQASQTVGIGVYSTSKGMRLVNPLVGLGFPVNPEGTPLPIIAELSGGKLHAGKFE
jgi:hypothetical protein